MAGIGISVSIEGAQQFRRDLQQLATTDAKKIMRVAYKKGSAIVRKDMRNRAPVGATRNLRRSIKSKVRVSSDGRSAIGIIFPRHEIAPHRHLVVRGTELRQTKTGASRGKMPVDDFVGESFDATYRRAGDVIEEWLSAGINAAWIRG